MIGPLGSSVDEALQEPAALDLIPADGRAGVAALARRLPDVMHGFGFELRLHPARAAVDFYTSIAARGGGREAWARWAQAAPSARPPEWERVAALARRWDDPSSPLHDRIEKVFLEFDAPFAAGQPPSVFARLDSAIGGGDEQWVAAAAAVDELALVWGGGQRWSAAARASVEAAFAALPPGGRIVDVAAMLPRGQVAMRLFVALPSSGLGGYLTALGWTDAEARRQLAALLQSVLAPCRYLSLQIDAGDGDRVGPRIGVEVSPSVTADGDTWPAVAERLRRAGLGAPSRLAALGRWPGIGPPRAIGGRWPSQLVRQLSHVKLVLEPARPIEAKVYLWATRRFAQLGG
ncbi:MAG TPA: hypothetical protein VMU50_10595 [Polyangia bacterium]|nr:hypothetical protein [Polyangia bacterium]